MGYTFVPQNFFATQKSHKEEAKLDSKQKEALQFKGNGINWFEISNESINVFEKSLLVIDSTLFDAFLWDSTSL